MLDCVAAVACVVMGLKATKDWKVAVCEVEDKTAKGKAGVAANPHSLYIFSTSPRPDFLYLVVFGQGRSCDYKAQTGQDGNSLFVSRKVH